MTLEQAIEKLTIIRLEYLYTFNQDPIDALGLGIEALKAVKHNRHAFIIDYQITLPSETKE